MPRLGVDSWLLGPERPGPTSSAYHSNMARNLSPSGWIQQLLHRHDLRTPDGRSLYAYRIDVDEFELLELILLVDATGSLERCALFCIYIAEWWRKHYDGGPWSWAEPLRGLNLHTDDYPKLYKPIQSGLAYWRRPLLKSDRTRQFLVTLCCEGGLPLGLLAREGNSLNEFFRRLLDEQARSALPRAALPAVAAHIAATTLSPRLCNEQVYALASDLVDAIVGLRPILTPSEDPVTVLDRVDPRWRDKLPLDLSDEAAVRIFRGLARQVTTPQFRQPTPLRVMVELHFVEQTWRIRRWIDVPRIVASDALGALLQIEPAPQLQIYAIVDGGAREPLALASRFSGPQGPRYLLERSGRARALSEHQSVELVSVAGAAASATLTPLGGAPLAALPWVFVPTSDAEDAGMPTTWRLHGQGSVRARANTILVALEPTDSWLADATVEQLGELTGLTNPRRLLRVHAGRLTVATPGGECVIHARAPEDTAPAYTLAGPQLLNLARTHPVFCGVPTLELQLADGLRTRVPLRELEWRASSHRDSWASVSTRAVGRIDLRYRVKGELHWWATLSVLPATTEIELIPTAVREGSIILRGADEQHAHLEGPPDAHIRELPAPANDARAWSCRTSGPVATPLTLAVVCKNGHTVRLSLPFPGIDLYFVDAAGHRLPDDATLFLGHLGGIAAQVTGTATSLSGARLDASLQTGQFRYGAAAETLLSLRLQPTRNGLVELQLAQLSSWAKLTLASTTFLDAAIRLTLHDGAKRTTSIYIRRYDTTLLPDHTTGHISLRADSVAPPERLQLECFPFWEPSRPPERLTILEPGRWHFARDAREPGAWLIVARDGEWCRARPLRFYVVPSADPGAADTGILKGRSTVIDTSLGLQGIIDLENEQLRREAHHKVLKEMAADPLHSDWDLLLNYVRTVGDLPTSTFEVVRALVEHPALVARCAIEIGLQAPERLSALWEGLEDLPFFWQLVPFTSWLAAVAYQADLIRDGLTATSLSATRIAELVKTSIDGSLAALESRSLGLGIVVQCISETLFGVVVQGSELSLARSPAGSQFLIRRLANEGAQELMRRHGESAWPSGDELRRVLAEPRFPIWPTVVNALPGAVVHRQPVLWAPILTACICGYATPASGALTVELRRLRAFDPEWFDLACATTLTLILAKHPSPPHPSIRQ